MSDRLKLDAKDWICPLPVLRALKSLKKMDSGQILEIEINNDKSLSELKKFCDETGHQLVVMNKKGDVYMLEIIKK